MYFPNESAEYRNARNALLQKEIAARRAIEAAAQARRELPLGGEIPEDYVFSECDAAGVPRNITLSQLMGDKHDTLVIYSYMFGPSKEEPCAMCTPLLDGINGVDDHIRQRVNFVAVADSSPERLWNWKRERGWDKLRLVSSGRTSYNENYHGKDSQGRDDTMVNVFRRKDGKIYHFWSSELNGAPKDPGQDHRAIDLLSPIFQLFDLTPEGRGDWYTKLKYRAPSN